MDIKRLPRKKKKITVSQCKKHGIKLLKVLRAVHKPCERYMVEVETKPISKPWSRIRWKIFFMVFSPRGILLDV